MPRHIVYRTTNLVNGKFYIGKHTLSDRSKYYLGSGYALRAAIQKYGRENFIRETLYEFDNLDDCFAKEQEIVNEQLMMNPMCYNITSGGIGGRIQSESTKLLIADATASHWKNDPARRIRISQASKQRIADGNAGVATWTDESKKTIAEKSSNRWKDLDYRKKVGNAISHSLTGRKLSEQHCENNRISQNQTQFCEHCLKEHKIASYGRWHGDKCKDKKS